MKASLVNQFKGKQALFLFSLFNIIDKAIVFVLPFSVLTIFNAKTDYISIEYIISVVNIIATFADFGLNGYMFYMYQLSPNKKKAIDTAKNTTNNIYLLLCVLSIVLLIVDRYFVSIHYLLVFIIIRLLYTFLNQFFISIFRLTDKPIKATYISIIINLASMLLLFIYFISDKPFNLWLIFLPQISLIILYFLYIIFKWRVNFNQQGEPGFFSTIKKSLLFSWPTIIQVFIMMFMANYAKINAFDKLPRDEAVFIGYTFRFTMIIQLAHASIIGYYAKTILSGENTHQISIKLLRLYLITIFAAWLFVVSALILYINYSLGVSADHLILISLFSVYTALWCIYSYFEMYYARINRNIIKLIMAVFVFLIFVIFLTFLPFSLIINIGSAMLFSTLFGLFMNLFLLKKNKFTFA